MKNILITCEDGACNDPPPPGSGCSNVSLFPNMYRHHGEQISNYIPPSNTHLEDTETPPSLLRSKCLLFKVRP